MRTCAYLLLALSLSLSAACGGGKKAAETTPVAPAEPTPAPEPAATPAASGDVSCDQVADHVIEVVMASDDYKNAKPEEQAQARDMMPQIRDQIVQECGAKAFTTEIKGCIMGASSMQDMEGCDAK